MGSGFCQNHGYCDRPFKSSSFVAVELYASGVAFHGRLNLLMSVNFI